MNRKVTRTSPPHPRQAQNILYRLYPCTKHDFVELYLQLAIDAVEARYKL